MHVKANTTRSNLHPTARRAVASSNTTPLANKSLHVQLMAWPLSAAALGFAVAVVGRQRRKRPRHLLIGSTFFLLGCGGGRDNAKRELPPTSLTITITGSAASDQRSATRN